ncbi:DUF1501 domain-containing protein [Humisphaera borealis]|uniref:DUF1501 domain-containing protein n=1 Tax=Humisphaera borealis TaxID=2807512 RepID=A0A7M2WS63_9BACT|nr:DUF1501 domain-containing protein [Humisphaera borealis]QOV88283.1 DUF1501 domain-containing protein [Humisphaera borealis]
MQTPIGRREFLASAAVGTGLSGWLGRLAAAAPDAQRPKSCILLWMAGGPSHIDTFDPKPEAADNVRGEFKAIETLVSGIRISEHFPRFAKLMQHAAILRGMSTLESDHKLATYHLHTGYQNRAGAVAFPSLGAIIARELGKRDVALPNFVTIGRAPQEAIGAGFLGPDHQPLSVNDPIRGLDFVEPAGDKAQFERQLELLQGFDEAFHSHYKSAAGETHRTAISRAVRLMKSQQKQAFDVSREPDAIRESYGPPPAATVRTAGGKMAGGAERPGSFGQACLMARRLVEAGVPFVEVVMGDGVGWDTHRDNFPRVRALSQECDAGMAALVTDLHSRGLLDTTLVVWMGEFGRTPQCTGGGRNHWSRAWSSVLVGGGIKGGQVIGRTDRDGAAVADRPISVPDFLATVCTVLGVDYKRKNHPPGVDRPIPIVDTSKDIHLLKELL